MAIKDELGEVGIEAYRKFLKNKFVKKFNMARETHKPDKKQALHKEEK